MPMTAPPRLMLAQCPTPLALAPATSARLGRSLWIKRDDLTGSHLSGNKVRKLEWLLADAMAQGATHVITCGGLQSNHCRATALAAAPLGLKPVLLLKTANGKAADLAVPLQGNLLLDRLVGAELRAIDAATYARWPEAMAAVADEVRAAGGRPYVIPEGGSSGMGALACAEVVDELATQCAEPPTAIFCATGSAGTLAGLAIGVKRRGWPTRVVGVAVLYDAPQIKVMVTRFADEAHAMAGTPKLEESDFEVLEGFRGRGYALTTPPEMALIAEVARGDGVVLDPVYTGKAWRGMLAWLGAADPAAAARPVFVHTGGLFGLMAFGSEIV